MGKRFAVWIMVLGTVVAVQPAAGQESTCHGFTSTTAAAQGFNVIDVRSATTPQTVTGSAGRDWIATSDFDDTVRGLGGDDRICTGGGDDFVDGGNGHDWVAAGAGADTVVGGRGNDWLVGGGGNDLLRGGSGNDALGGRAGADRLLGGAGDDTINGNRGDDRLSGGGGDDTLSGNAGNDRVRGNLGNDNLSGGDGVDTVEGGPGIDECDPGSTPGDSATSCESDAPPEWRAPIGVPTPPFGITNTHHDLAGGLYDFGSGPEPYPDAGNGPYTHYIDNSVACDDDNNDGFGSPAAPLCGLPRTFSAPAGSIIEFHGGPYVSTNWWQWTGAGTESAPVYFRGADPEVRVVLSEGQLRLGGTYTIYENFELIDASSVRIQYESPERLTVRNLEVHNEGHEVGWGSAIQAGGREIVVWDNHIHHNRRVDGKDAHGVGSAPGAERIWILDNHIHHNSGDGVQVCHNCSPRPSHVWIGRNEFHDDRENAIDIKNVTDVVISQNVMYSYRDAPESDGTALVINNRGDYPKERVWILFNEVSDALHGIRIQDSAWVVGNIVHDIHHDSADETFDPASAWQAASAIISWQQAEVHLIANTLYDVDSGIAFPGGGWTGRSALIHDNIIAGLTEPSFHAAVRGSDMAAASTLSHNLFEGSTGIQWDRDELLDLGGLSAAYPGLCAGCVEADAGFVNARAADFSLSASSAALDGASGKLADFVTAYCGFYSDEFADCESEVAVDFNRHPRPAGTPTDLGAIERP